MGTPKGTVPWNAGTSKGWIDKRGYRWICVVEGGKRRAKREHRHVVELSIGRALTPEEVVHHKNGIKSDNRLENLEVVKWGAHTASHHKGTRQSEYTRRTQSVVSEYREELKRMKSSNVALLEALCEARDLLRDCGPEANEFGLLDRVNAAIAAARGEA